MAKELIKGDSVLQGVVVGEKRVSDCGGFYLLPAQHPNAEHSLRFDYSFGGKRKTISFGTYPSVGLKLARDRGRMRHQSSSQRARTRAQSEVHSWPAGKRNGYMRQGCRRWGLLKRSHVAGTALTNPS